jgi:hypothetical protein
VRAGIDRAHDAAQCRQCRAGRFSMIRRDGRDRPVAAELARDRFVPASCRLAQHGNRTAHDKIYIPIAPGRRQLRAVDNVGHGKYPIVGKPRVVRWIDAIAGKIGDRRQFAFYRFLGCLKGILPRTSVDPVCACPIAQAHWGSYDRSLRLVDGKFGHSLAPMRAWRYRCRARMACTLP